WRKVLAPRAQARLAALWPWSLATSSVLIVFALGIATTGFVPGVQDPEIALSVMLFCLGMQVILLPLTFVSGFACDLAPGSSLLQREERQSGDPQIRRLTND
ncbi:MAG TPA: hypothetical protein VK880_10370, partial [Anaerolineales bacterium]|nr:hypothetical protein [Anaerolineales bacterium]